MGGSGFLGAYVVARLHADGHRVIGASRNVDGAARRFPFARWERIDLAALTEPAAWMAHLDGVDAIVNCAGALQDSSIDDLSAVHGLGALALFRACAERGVRIVHISAAGVAPDATTAFFVTKSVAEEGLKAMTRDFVILRPGLILAPGAFGGSALLRGLAAFPFAMPVLRPEAVVQVVAVEDVAEAVCRALVRGTADGASIDLVHPARTHLADILRALRGWLGLPSAPVVTVPAPLVRLFARGADGLAVLGWMSPLRSTAVQQLEQEVTGDGGACAARLGFSPRSLEEMLAGWPSSLQDRRFARLYFLKPVMLATLAVFWIASGAIGVCNFRAAVATLTDGGLTTGIAAVAVAAGALADIALGLAVCVRRTAGPALIGMVGLSFAYLAGATVFTPLLWIDPLGPLVKVIPGMVLALIGLAMLDER